MNVAYVDLYPDRLEQAGARGLGADGSLDGLPRRMAPNVGVIERSACSVLGLSLVGIGLARRGPVGWMAAAAGGALAWHGLKPHSFLYGAIGLNGEDAGPWSQPLSREVHSRASVTINRPPSELFEHWRQVDGLVRFFPHIERIEEIGPDRCRWTASLPGGRSISWEADWSEDEAERRITWGTAEDSPVDHHGVVVFTDAPAGRGARVQLEMRFHLPGGAFGIAIAKLMGSDPEQEASKALRRFKQWAEAGEIATSASPAARGDGWTEQPDKIHPLTPPPERSQRTQTGGAADSVDQASEESFPASDPPGSHHSTSAPAHRSTQSRH